MKQIMLVWVLTLLLLSACAQDEGSPTEEPPLDDISVTEPAPTSTPRPAATLPPTSTPEPTPVVPSITVDTPSLTEDGSLLIREVVMPEASWLVIYQDVGGEPGEILGYEYLEAGENSPVTVIIEARDATPTLIARLHEDAGDTSVFEYPGPDIPITVDEEIVTKKFQVDIQLRLPSIDAANQLVASDGLVLIKNVFALEPGWLVIHNREGDEVGPAIGQVPVQAGQSDGVSVPIRWQIASMELLAVLYEDKERPGGFDKDADRPVLDGGSSVAAAFEVTLPPDIFVYDQPLDEGKITIERATSDGPGWIAVSYDEGGQPGYIIGFAHLEDGVNELVEIDVVETAVTQQLLLILHEDTGKLGEFNFPVNDLPVVFEGQTVAPFILKTSPGNYLITQDQPLGEENSITVPLVVTDLDTWIVVYNLDETGEAGEVIGQTWAPAGINRDVLVTIDADRSSETILAMLHQDIAPLKQFAFPDGGDVPLLRNLLPIQSPFVLQKPAVDLQPLP